MMTEKTVLIIDDEVDAADMFGEMMRVSGFRVLKTYTSSNAFSLVEAEHPDLVILDVMMPDISGIEILKQIRSEPELAAIPVIIVSAMGMPADVKIALDTGASIYLTKPVGFAELKSASEKAMRDPRQTGRLSISPS